MTTGSDKNDRVAMQWYAARDEQGHATKAPAIIVVHESGSGMTVGQLMAKGLRNQGFHTFMIQLPGYGLRKEGSRKTDGDLFLLRIKQSIADVRRARDAVAALPLVDADHIAVQGTSSSAHFRVPLRDRGVLFSTRRRRGCRSA
ncbi:hypothetical protein DSM3645_04400 [Blastopirellula marina DSM 3645]|uniref:Serine aminopeptidase S33 domain-containing protein n=1 Tax=Blastopirellula marina DSM 3645 TaxID=314230 RepID=A4A1I0_9BACT|nr:hypothetical protein DSM3645_04400 [Blastopirellula marina DSM 3645]